MPRIQMPSEKPLHWAGSAKKDLLGFPEAVVDDFGYALGAVQMGATPPQAKMWKGEGSAVWELVESHRGDTFRAVYTVRFAGMVFVLHAFQKKSKKGIATPKAEIDLIKGRLNSAREAAKRGKP